MRTLHQLSMPIDQLVTKDIFLDAIAHNDKILLHQHAILSNPNELKALSQRCEICALAEDVTLYQLAMPDSISLMNYSEWAQLIAEVDSVNTWA